MLFHYLIRKILSNFSTITDGCLVEIVVVDLFSNLFRKFECCQRYFFPETILVANFIFLV